MVCSQREIKRNTAFLAQPKKKDTPNMANAHGVNGSDDTFPKRQRFEFWAFPKLFKLDSASLTHLFTTKNNVQRSVKMKPPQLLTLIPPRSHQSRWVRTSAPSKN